MIGFAAVRLFRSIDVPAVRKLQTLLAALSAVALSAALWSFWVPISWRSSDSGIERLAKRAHDAGIFAQSTLIVYETATTNGRTSLINDPAVELLMPSTREAWQEEPRRGIPLNRLTAFNQKVAGALHRNGVPIMAGTDALGLPLVAPGNSLHRELQLLTASGFSPYEAIRSATVVPAAFLGKRCDGSRQMAPTPKTGRTGKSAGAERMIAAETRDQRCETIGRNRVDDWPDCWVNAEGLRIHPDV